MVQKKNAEDLRLTYELPKGKTKHEKTKAKSTTFSLKLDTK